MHTECIFHTPIIVLKTVKIYLRTHTQCSIIYLCCFPRLGMYWCAQTCKVILENQNIIRDLGYTSVLKPVRLNLRTHTYMKMYLSIFLRTFLTKHQLQNVQCPFCKIASLQEVNRFGQTDPTWGHPTSPLPQAKETIKLSQGKTRLYNSPIICLINT